MITDGRRDERCVVAAATVAGRVDMHEKIIGTVVCVQRSDLAIATDSTKRKKKATMVVSQHQTVVASPSNGWDRGNYSGKS